MRSESLLDRSVLLACDRQLAAALALIDLDGVARRIVLCPPDLSEQHLSHVLEAAGVDVVVSDRSLSECSGRPVVEARGHMTCARGGARGERRPTEWILFTSGTTGRPKMVVHSLETLAAHLPSGPPGGAGAVWCTFYDIRRYGGLQILLRALVGGGSLVFSSASEPPGDFLARAAACGATHFLGTPSHWRRALMSGKAGLVSPDYVRLSGEIADQPILDTLRAAYPKAKLVHAFASTEAGVVFEVADGQAGFPAAFLDREDDGPRLRVQDRTLRVRSSRVAVGRIGGGPSDLADADGFVDTGDIVERRLDRCFFVGRAEGIVNVGGQKVHPEEVETVINRHPGVRMSLVRPRSNPITGAVVVAEIVARAEGAPERGATLTAEILALCRRDLPAHKVPATIRLVPSLEIAPSGKLVRPHA